MKDVTFVLGQIDDMKLPKYYVPDKFNIENYKEFSEDFIYNLIVKRPATYYDKNKRILHCNEFRNRSITDLYIISKTYFPNITFKQYLDTIHNTKYIGAELCSDIQKYVYWHYINTDTIYESLHAYSRFYNNNTEVFHEDKETRVMYKDLLKYYNIKNRIEVKVV